MTTRPVRSLHARSLPRTLAVVFAAGLLTSTAAPALAAPSDADTPPESVVGTRESCMSAPGTRAAETFNVLGASDAGRMLFYTPHRLTPDRITVYASKIESFAYSSVGPIVEVPAGAVAYHPEIQQGEVDIPTVRAALGIPDGGTVLLRLAVDGAYQDCQAFGTDPQAPDVIDAPLARTRHQMALSWWKYPAEFERTWAINTDDYTYAVRPTFMIEASFRVLEEPQHGELREVLNDAARTDPTSEGHPPSGGYLAYRADEGYTGDDGFVLEWTNDDGETRVERVTVRRNEDRRVVDLYRINSRNVVWEGRRLHVGMTGRPGFDDPDAPVEDPAPAPDPQPAPTPEPEDSHEMPGTVETGIGIGGWIVGLAGVGAVGAAVGLRRTARRDA